MIKKNIWLVALIIRTWLFPKICSFNVNNIINTVMAPSEVLCVQVTLAAMSFSLVLIVYYLYYIIIHIIFYIIYPLFCDFYLSI